jgi:hypothetical protein
LAITKGSSYFISGKESEYQGRFPNALCHINYSFLKHHCFLSLGMQYELGGERECLLVDFIEPVDLLQLPPKVVMRLERALEATQRGDIQ